MAKRVTMKKEYTLPMKGLTETPEGFIQVPKVELRAMTTMEEKTRLSGNGYRTLINLLKSCCNTKVDLENMNTGDVQYMIYMLRSLTYGANYDVSVQCPVCGKINKMTVNLEELPVNEDMDDDFNGIKELDQLPVSGDVITCKLETSKDLEAIDREVARIHRKFPEYVGDPAMIIKWCHRIVEINGNKVSSNDIQRYVESMHALDYQFMDSKYDKFISQYSIDTSLFVTCEDCGEEFEASMPMNSEFFRPRY